MAKTKGIICYRGSVGGSSALHLYRGEILGVTSDSALSALATGMAPKTLSLVRERTWYQTTSLNTDTPPANRNVDRIATVFFREGGVGTVRRFSFPLPQPYIVEGRGSGERLTTTAVNSIVALLETATGLTLYPLYGIVTQKR